MLYRNVTGIEHCVSALNTIENNTNFLNKKKQIKQPYKLNQ